MAGKPYPRPVSSRRRRLSKEETDAMIAWKTGSPFLKRMTRMLEAHHIITQQALRKRGHADLLWDTRNRLWLTRERHAQHHSCYRKIHRSELPQEALDFAEEIGMTWWIDHVYPVGEVTEGGKATKPILPVRDGAPRDYAQTAGTKPASAPAASDPAPPSVTSSDEGLEAA